jgi:hypothetical protein
LTTLQLQHYGIYPHVGRDAFADYIRANNRAAFLPAILPAMLLLLTSIILTASRPVFMPAKTRLLLSTNWIRTVAFLVQAVLANGILVRAL